MEFVQTKNIRRFIGELSRGMEVGRALTRLLEANAIRCGHVRIMGHVESVELLTDGPKGPATVTRNINKTAQLVSCEGIITELNGKFEPVLYTLLSFEGAAGSVVLGGVLASATIISCDIIVEAYDDLFVRRSVDPKLKLPVWVQVFADETEGDHPAPAPVSSLRYVEEEPEEEEEEYEDEDIPEPGDTVMHFKFGRCLVMKFERENDILQVKPDGKRSLRLGINVLTFTFVKELEDGTKLYKANKRSQ